MWDSYSAPILPFYAGFFLYPILICISYKKPSIFIYLSLHSFPFYAHSELPFFSFFFFGSPLVRVKRVSTCVSSFFTMDR